LQMLDPYIQILTEGLLSKYDKIAALSLKVWNVYTQNTNYNAS
jgi:hypothetical protein